LIFDVPSSISQTRTDVTALKWYRQTGVLLTSMFISDAFIPNLVRIFHPIHHLRRLLALLCIDDQE